MSIPALTAAQIFNNQVNSVITYVAAALTGNLNVIPPQGVRAPTINLQSVYSTCRATLFGNDNGTASQAITILSTQAANVLSFLTWLYNGLVASGVTGLTALPAYTANEDGTVTLS